MEVLILQHPLEVTHPKNSARLLQLCLTHSRIVVGESFSDVDVLRLPWAEAAASRRALLLYPENPLDQAPDLKPPPALDPAWLRDPAGLRLVVLDATWRKSRKMLYASPALQRLPRLALHDLPASRYLIRKAHRPGQLSTLEAACAALTQIEGDDVDVRPVLQAFDGFVRAQAADRFQG